MQKRGGGRFGKYGDLKRKEKIRQTRVLKRDDKVKARAQRAMVNGQKRDQLRKLSTDGVVGERPGPDRKPNGEAENSLYCMDSQDSSDHKKKRANVSIRTMEIDDLATVFHLGEKLFTAREVPNLYRTWDEFEVVTLYQADSEFCLVAELDDEMVGFALGTTVTKSHSAWKYGHLVWLGINPEVQGHGVATRLFHRFRDIMIEEGVRMMLVDSEADNLPALYFFRKMGFGSPQEHIYLTLNLDPQLRQHREKKVNGRSTSRYRTDDDD